MKFILGTLSAAVIAGVAFVQPAEARCFFNGFGWQCYHPYHHYWNHGPYWHRGW